MSKTFVIPRSFSPSHSLYGRWLRRRMGDRLRAEAFYLFTTTIAWVVLTLLYFLTWNLLGDGILDNPDSLAAILFWCLQTIVPLLFILIGMIGRRPRIKIRLGNNTLTIRRRDQQLDIDPATISDVRLIDSSVYHRHFRRYETTVPFINRPVRSVLIVRIPSRTLAFGLTREDAEQLCSMLSTACAKQGDTRSPASAA